MKELWLLRARCDACCRPGDSPMRLRLDQPGNAPQEHAEASAGAPPTAADPRVDAAGDLDARLFGSVVSGTEVGSRALVVCSRSSPHASAG